MIRNFVISAILGVVFGASPTLQASANEISDCVDIDDSLARLQCYDDAMKTVSDVEVSPEEALQRLRKLVFYEAEDPTRAPYGDVFGPLDKSGLYDSLSQAGVDPQWNLHLFLVREDVFTDDCLFWVQRTWRIWEFKLDQNGSLDAPLAQPTAEMPLAIYIDAMDLGKVDPDKTFRGDWRVTMVRDHAISRWGFVSLGWNSPQDLQTADVGAHGITFKSDALMMTSNSDRSFDIRLGRAFEEDSEEIKSAFNDLVLSCQDG